MIWGAVRSAGRGLRDLYRRHRTAANEHGIGLGAEIAVTGGLGLLWAAPKGWDEVRKMYDHDVATGAFEGDVEDYVALLAQRAGVDEGGRLSRVGGVE